MIPGRTLHRLSRLACPADFHHRVIEAQLADFQDEWQRASTVANRIRVLSLGYLAFWSSVGLWAGCAVRDEIAAMTWRNSFAFPGLAVVIALIAISDSWVRTGSLWDQRFDSIDTRFMWAMLPATLFERWYPALRGARGLPVTVPLTVASIAAIVTFDPFQGYFRGWIPLVSFVVVGTLLQHKDRPNRQRSG